MFSDEVSFDYLITLYQLSPTLLMNDVIGPIVWYQSQVTFQFFTEMFISYYSIKDNWYNLMTNKLWYIQPLFHYLFLLYDLVIIYAISVVYSFK